MNKVNKIQICKLLIIFGYCGCDKESSSDVKEKNYHTDYKHYSAIIEGQVNTIKYNKATATSYTHTLTHTHTHTHTPSHTHTHTLTHPHTLTQIHAHTRYVRTLCKRRQRACNQ